MTMPRKGSRAITIGNDHFRFMVREDGRRMRVTVEQQDHPGHVLIVSYDTRRCPAVGTTEVAAFIRWARDEGWSPYSMDNFGMADTNVDEALGAIGR